MRGFALVYEAQFPDLRRMMFGKSVTVNNGDKLIITYHDTGGATVKIYRKKAAKKRKDTPCSPR